MEAFDYDLRSYQREQDAWDILVEEVRPYVEEYSEQALDDFLENLKDDDPEFYQSNEKEIRKVAKEEREELLVGQHSPETYTSKHRDGEDIGYFVKDHYHEGFLQKINEHFNL